MKPVKVLSLSALLGSALVLGACSDDAETGATTDEGTEGGGEQLQGEIAIDGSSTVYPIAEAVAEEFMLEQPDVQVTVGLSGTGGGFEKFIAGETQFSNASRPIKDEESQALADAGIEFTELQLAYDGLSVVVNKDNDWVDQLTVDELKKMWVDNGTAVKWSDVREGWPEEEIKFYSPGTDSGTYDYFNEVILEDAQINKTATLSEDDNVLVQGVTGDANAIGYFGYAYYLENKDNIKVVPIVNEAGEAVEPNAETIESGEYAPLSRPLFTYVSNAAIADEEAVAAYAQFTLENAAALAEDVGYVSLPEEKYTEQLETIEGLK
ncbi:PstS family phosphate ABC transporter substrate-binding protein [Domibacillus enclensis]|uniref:Phosphate-binding protein n=1 Tax=Domibacillus enclensis TaxID=1017273 RepID=A0A1N6PLP3_9BACI|nr:PstS family phosphate ABC transporter substrate-binding protein [Domibacillus enclensis]OXS80412.1 phosphate-binding protein [Domibacillus enclensis]SIQ05285.1 phosphate ABC transporter substrate-binding protein, PhoT family [Domibacillus enclensis]